MKILTAVAALAAAWAVPAAAFDTAPDPNILYDFETAATKFPFPYPNDYHYNYVTVDAAHGTSVQLLQRFIPTSSVADPNAGYWLSYLKSRSYRTSQDEALYPTYTFDAIAFDNDSAVNNNSLNDTSWQRISFGPLGGQVIQLTGRVFIDNFSISYLSVSVPEPAQWAMTIAGFGLVGGLARRRRERVVIA